MSAESDINQAIPKSLVLSAAVDLLNEAEWRFGRDEAAPVTVPKQPAPCVATCAFIKAHVPDIFIGDHYEAVVYLAPAQVGENVVPAGGSLRLYFTLAGELVSGDYIPYP